VLRAGEDAALSHRTAAELYGLTRGMTRGMSGEGGALIHVTVPASRRARIIRRGVVHFSRYLERTRHPVELDGRVSHPPEQRWDDSHRDNAHASLGIMTVRYNWQDVNYRSCSVAAQVGGLLQMRGTAVQLRRCGPSCTAAS
jgi:hypothetical protein